jgi:hypothetical protein
MNTLKNLGRPVTVAVGTNTDEIMLLSYACDLFLRELTRIIEEELKSNQEGVFQDLLKKAMYIINRIKSKAATSAGIVGGGALASAMLPATTAAVTGTLPMSPSIGNHRQYSPPKSWHFDVGNRDASEHRQVSRGSNVKNASPQTRASKGKQGSPQSRRPYHAAARRPPETRGTLSSDSHFMSRFTTNVLSSNLGVQIPDPSCGARFESGFARTNDESSTQGARHGETLSEAMLGTKSNAGQKSITGIGSGSYYMKQNKHPMLLSEHTFKG